MGFRFRKSFKLAPGLRLNLSKSGPSLSIGGNGLTHNISKKGGRTTVSLPGTGLSYTSSSSSSSSSQSQPKSQASSGLLGTVVIALFLIALIGGLSNSDDKNSIENTSPVATNAPPEIPTETFQEIAPDVIMLPIPSSGFLLGDTDAKLSPNFTAFAETTLKKGSEIKIVGSTKNKEWLIIEDKDHNKQLFIPASNAATFK